MRDDQGARCRQMWLSIEGHLMMQNSLPNGSIITAHSRTGSSSIAGDYRSSPPGDEEFLRATGGDENGMPKRTRAGGYEAVTVPERCSAHTVNGRRPEASADVRSTECLLSRT